jgi:hypothetical protein
MYVVVSSVKSYKDHIDYDISIHANYLFYKKEHPEHITIVKVTSEQ